MVHLGPTPLCAVELEADMMSNMQNKTTTESGPESPTTAVPLDFDDDDVQSTGVLGDDGPRSPAPTTTNAPKAAPSATAEAAPAKPPRPLTEAQKNEAILKEAFPTVEQGVIRAILRASGGNVEPAFNALLGELYSQAIEMPGN